MARFDISLTDTLLHSETAIDEAEGPVPAHIGGRTIANAPRSRCRRPAVFSVPKAYAP